MQCPHCQVPLSITERQSIEIDYCPQCRGVWLDRGELDKLIERSQSPQNQQSHNSNNQQQQPRQQTQSHQQHHGGYDKHYKNKKKKSLLSELFDF